MNESLTRRISWGAKQTSTAAVVSPSKKPVEESSSDGEEAVPKSGKMEASATAGGSAEASGSSKRRRAATFDFVGTGTDAENYEDQFKQAYHDETDMEDAFADDAKDHVMDDSDAEHVSVTTAPAASIPTAVASDAAASAAPTTADESQQDAAASKKKSAKEDPDAPPPTLSQAMKAATGSSPDDEKQQKDENGSSTALVASSSAPAVPTKPSKPSKHTSQESADPATFSSPAAPAEASSSASKTSTAPVTTEDATKSDATSTNANEPSSGGDGDDATSTPSKSGKKPSKKKSKANVKKGKGKPGKSIEALQEEGEDSDSHSISSTAAANHTQQTPAVAASPAPDTPSRKKSNATGFMGFLKRLGGSKSHKHASGSNNNADEIASSDHEIDSAAALSATASTAATSSTSQAAPAATSAASASPSKDASAVASASDGAPKTPRGAKAPKVDPYEAMKAELKSYTEMERAFIQDLHTLLEEYLLPAKKLPVPIEHVSVLCAPVEHMISSHSDTLKIVEKKSKDEHFAVGSIFDDLLAAVSDSYKLYRSKQVLLLSLLDSSPTEKSMADHAAISNWLETHLEEQQEQPGGGKHSKKDVPPLQELVLEPMHRLAGIAFLLEQLTVVTPQTHPDFPNIRKACARVHLLQQELSMRGTTYRSMAKLSEIDAMLEFPYGVPSFQLADESAKRSFLLEGPVHQLEQHSDHSEFSKVYFFLFNDMLLICKQLARDPGSTPNNTKQARRNAGSRQNSVVRQLSGVNATGTHIVHSPANKYIVLSRLVLDRLFLVDPEDTGEMAAFGVAKSKRREFPPSEESSAPSNTTSTSAAAPTSSNAASSLSSATAPTTPAKGSASEDGGKSKSSPEANSINAAQNERENEDDIEELKDVDRLLEIVDMGVAIHRLRFSTRDDKKLWLATLNSAFSNIKLSFGSNERQYLYKLLLATQPCKPILGTDPDSESLAAWPSARFVASSATRHLLERLHSHTFSSVNFHKSNNPAHPASSDSDMALVKQEVANLKREHLRQLAELSAQHERDQLEIAALQKDVRTKEEVIISQTRQARSDTVESVDSTASGSTAPTPSKKKKGKTNVDESVLQKSVERLESHEHGMLKRLDIAEFTMKSQSEQFSKAIHAMTKEMEEMRSERKAMVQQQERLSALLERFMSNASTTGLNGSSLLREQSGDKPAPGTVAAARESVIRQSSGVSKPPVPSKPGTGTSVGQTSNAIATTTTTTTAAAAAAASPKVGASGAPTRQVSGAWRGSVGSPTLQSASTASATNGSLLNVSIIGPGSPVNSTVASFGSKGKRPSSVSLIAAVPLEQLPPSESGVADSSESSGPRGGSTTGPNVFGTSGKSPSRLNLSAAQSAAATDKPGPVSPGGRGKERKVKNLRFPNGENEGGSKSGNWLQKKLGLSSKDKPRRDDSSGQIAPGWRQTPSSAGAAPDAPITVKKANKVDWSQARAEAYLSDDLGSDYDPAMAMSPSDFERNQEEFMAPDNVGSDYSDEGEGH